MGIHLRGLRVLLAYAVAMLVLSGANASASVTIDEFGSMDRPQYITQGPDGNMWVTSADPSVTRITPAGATSTFTAGISPSSVPVGITTGPDGNLWYLDNGGSEKVVRVTTAGVITEFPQFMPGGLSHIIDGGDGNLWWTQFADDKLTRFDPLTQNVDEFALPTLSSLPGGLTVGPDGAIWFAEFFAEKIGRMTTSGVVTDEFPSASGAADITLGPDGNLWYTLPMSAQIGRMTPTGVETLFNEGITGSGPARITTGSDGKLWFTQTDSAQVASITTSGVVTEYGVADGISSDAGPMGITAGPNNTIWFTEFDGDRVGRITLDITAPDTTIDSGPSGTIATDQATFTFSGTPLSDTEEFQCRIDAGSFADCTSPQSFTGLADGPHTVTFRAEDAVGNQDATPATRTFTVDTTAPDTTIDSGPSGTITTGQATFTFSGTPLSDTEKFQCRIDAGSFADCTSPQSFTGLAEGPHTVSFRAEDAVGNQDATPAARTFTVDTTPPPPDPPQPVAARSVVVEPVNGKVRIKLPGKGFVPVEEVRRIPVGSVVDTRNGTVELTSAAPGPDQTARFKFGLFKVTQSKGRAETVLKLQGPLANCPKAKPKKRTRGLLSPVGFVSGATVSGANISRSSGRSVWGRGKGSFTTSGRRGSGSVRGTTWQVTDRCDGSTVIKNFQGRVLARDFVRNGKKLLRSGQSLVARPPRR